jgi:hypothetical protein
MGAILAVVLAKLFMSAYPVLRVDQFSNLHAAGTEKWQSAMTFKFVGALKGITTSQPHVMKALRFGILLGLAIEICRKAIKSRKRYQQFVANSWVGQCIDFLIDAVFLCSPYASSFGGFVELPAVLWWTLGGVGSSLFDFWQAKTRRAGESSEGELPADMSTMSLSGGGLIAGDSLAALSVGVYGLLKAVL